MGVRRNEMGGCANHLPPEIDQASHHIPDHYNCIHCCDKNNSPTHLPTHTHTLSGPPCSRRRGWHVELHFNGPHGCTPPK